MNDLSQLKIQGISDPWRNPGEHGWDVIDGAGMSGETTLEADVAIIGSGAGGGVSAEILSRAGLKVVIIEAARLKSSDGFDMNEAEAYRDLYQEGAAQASKDGNISILQGRAVGGTTVVNWTSSFRTPPETLDHWRNQFGVEGLNQKAMAPWFERMEQRLKVSRWLIAPNANNDVLRRGCEKLGWDWASIPRNVDGCWNLGYCGMGCPTNAKQSMLVTTLPGALDQGATLVHSCQADKLVIHHDRVSAVDCTPLDRDRKPSGARLRVKAKQVVAAGGGIHTPGLLMRSAVPDPEGRVGKRTFLHVTSFASGLFADTIAPYYGAPQSTYSDHFVWRDGVTGAMGYKLEMMPLHPGLAGALTGGWGEAHRQSMEQLPHTAGAIAMMRDGFHEQSPGGTVELRDDNTPVLDYQLNDYVLEGVRHSQLTMTEMLFAAGATRVRPRHSDADFYDTWKQAREAIRDFRFEPYFTPLGSAHVMGGCAMGSDEHYCVTDSRGRYRHLENLHVFDGSVLPTSLGVNPQLTIYALTARNASLLAEEMTA
jgi:choline dehydrogenase-like flavoprotein